MSTQQNNSDGELRRSAEEKLVVSGVANSPTLAPVDDRRLLHELQVHQIELEMQNEQLSHAIAEKEAMEALYKDLYEFAPVGYFNLDRAGVIHAVNLTGAALLGVERSLLVRKRLDIFISGKKRPEFGEFLKKVFADDFKQTLESVLATKHDSPRYVQIEAVVTESRKTCRAVILDITGRKLADEALTTLNRELESRVAGRTAELVVTVEKLEAGIVERERAEANLLRLNRLYRVLSETNHAIVRTRDRDTLFDDVCRIAVEDGGFLLAWVGMLPEECGELPVTASFGATGYLQGLRIAATGEPFGMGPTGTALRTGACCVCNDFMASPLTRPWHEQGAAYGIRASASVPLGLEGKLIGVLTLYTDEKDFFDLQQIAMLEQMGADLSFALNNFHREALRREADRALQAESAERLLAIESLREKDRMLIQQSRHAAMGEMISNIAHQWRQPLNALALSVQEQKMMSDFGECTAEFMTQSVGKSMGIIQHMSQTIDDFMNYFKPDKDKFEFKLSEVVASTLLLVEDSFKHQHVGVDVVTLRSPLVFGYRNEYAQALLNILNNARDALKERGTEHPRVTITLSSADGRAVITIADNAGGIPEEIIGKIFDPYFTTKGPQAGSGLGLFMSKAIIEKNLGGSLTVRNADDGAEFRVEV